MKWSDFLVKPTQYSNFDISCTKRYSASDGILYPVWHEIMNPGEIFRMNMRSLIRTNPTKAPLMGRFKVRFVTVVSNFKNYAVGLEGYRRSFDWRTFTLPYFRFQFGSTLSPLVDDDYGNMARFMAVRETSLADYLGYERGWLPTSQQYPDAPAISSSAPSVRVLSKSALPFLVYYDFYRNYLVNPQEGYYPIFVSRSKSDYYSEYYTDEDGQETQLTSSQRHGSASYLRMNSISQLDEIFESVHKQYDGDNTSYVSAININSNDNTLINWRCTPSDVVTSVASLGRLPDCSSWHGGLVATMFDPDINNQWLSTSNFNKLDEVRVKTNYDDTGLYSYSSFADIVKASSLWDFVSREIYNGGTYADHIYSQYGVSVKADMNIPQIVHIYDTMVNFEDITAQSDTANDSSNSDTAGAKLGEQAGVGRGYGQSPRFTIRNLDNNYSMVMTFMWITPMVDYHTGLDQRNNIVKFSDLYTPAFDNYALQPRLQEQVNSAVVADGDVFGPLSSVRTSSIAGYKSSIAIGYQPSFSEYKTSLNRVHGLFANGLNYWVILRKMPNVGFVTTASGSIWNNSISSYVWSAPVGADVEAKFAHGIELPFSVEDEDNFFCQLRVECIASRPMSKSAMPGVKR